jgi:hypothetical protein
LASQAPGGNLSSRETRHLPGTRAQPSGCRAHKLRTVSSSRTRRHVAHSCSLKAALLCGLGVGWWRWQAAPGCWRLAESV